MNAAPDSLGSRVVRRLFSRMRFPWLFVLFALMLAIDLALPDIVPFLDEAILALGTALFAMWKERRLIADDQSHAGRSVAAQASPPR